MTTDDIENEEETQRPRDINVLLELDTYQGMTDEEIDLLLEYKIDHSITQRELAVLAAAEANRAEQCIADNRASAARALDMIQSIIEATFPTVAPVQPKRFEARSLEL